MQEIAVRFHERLVSVHLADPNEVLPQLSADVVATVPPETGSQNDAAAQLEKLRASLDELRSQLTTRTLQLDEPATAGEPTPVANRADSGVGPTPASAANSPNDVRFLHVESGAST